MVDQIIEHDYCIKMIYSCVLSEYQWGKLVQLWKMLACCIIKYQYKTNNFELLQGSIMPAGNTFFTQTAVAEQQMSVHLI